MGNDICENVIKSAWFHTHQAYIYLFLSPGQAQFGINVFVVIQSAVLKQTITLYEITKLMLPTQTM